MFGAIFISLPISGGKEEEYSKYKYIDVSVTTSHSVNFFKNGYVFENYLRFYV